MTKLPYVQPERLHTAVELAATRRDHLTCVHCLRDNCELFACPILPSGPECLLNTVSLCRWCKDDKAGHSALIQIDSDLRHTHALLMQAKDGYQPTQELVSEYVAASIETWGARIL
jgi:hypothetical protein